MHPLRATREAGRGRDSSGKAARRRLLLVWLAILAGASLRASPPPVPRPAAPPRTDVERTITLDRIGDGKLVVVYRYSPQAYRNITNRCRPWQPRKPDGSAPPPKPPEIALFLRTTPLSRMGLDPEGVRGNFDDATHTVRLECVVRGLARPVRDDRWEALLGQELDLEPEEAEVRGNTVVLKSTTPSGPGVTALTCRIEVPAGSNDLRMLRSPPRLAYRLPALPAPAGTTTSADFRFEARPHLMTCAAKCYSSDRFPQLWAARTALRNTGDQPIRDYRVRFRLAEYAADWSEWRRCPTVLPGQTVVDLYFPILDIDKVNQLEGRRATTLKVEYEYTQADGKVVRDDDVRRLEILGRNEMVTSSLPPEQWNNDFLNVFNNGPLALACFVTRDDPVVREAAGMISGKMPGLDATGWTDDSALVFLASIYDFLQHNKVAYQLPPGLFDGRDNVQHVKYARDVLRNRAGTCIDLAIFFASVCEAVGLEPVLFLVPGHCYPAVRLPDSGRLIAVESTRIQRIDFATALQEATEGEMKDVFSGKTPAHVVDVMELRKQGVSGMELPPLSGVTLDTWKYQQGRVDPNWAADMAAARRPRAAAAATNSIGMKLVLVPAMRPFTLGSPREEGERNDDEMAVSVLLTQAFYMGSCEVTQAEYQRVMGKNPSWFSATGGGREAVAGMDTSRFPVEQVSWADAKAFCDKLSALPAEKAAGRVYRLPTEAEWEYACRAGTTTAFNVGGLISSRDANIVGDRPYLNSPAGPSLKRTAAVGSYRPSKFGLFDMHGNVGEWCQDWYAPTRSSGTLSAREIMGTYIDPTGPATGTTRVLRGGSFLGSVSLCRSAARRDRDPDYSHRTLGFRVVCPLPPGLRP